MFKKYIAHTLKEEIVKVDADLYNVNQLVDIQYDENLINFIIRNREHIVLKIPLEKAHGLKIVKHYTNKIENGGDIPRWLIFSNVKKYQNDPKYMERYFL